MEVRYLAITMIIPLVLGGCFAGDFMVAMHDQMMADKAYGKIFRYSGYAVGGPNRVCNPDNPEACAEAWREISDADFCKRYSPTNKLVARELERRKLDCSKLGDSASSK
jgi:hypothetical protein